ncbi:prepilin peptidase [Candidatus Pacearchaeota archaeon]|nr:prepilin peptidase [Candidatus Pacearchaeota archaeon]
MISDYLLIAVAFIWLAAATIQDLKKREVANWLSFSLVAVALAIRAFSAIIYKDAWYFIYGVIGFIIFFGIANLLYYGRIFAGGDAKLLMGIGVIFATKPDFVQITDSILKLPFAGVFVINTLVVGSAYGILYSIVLGLKNARRFKKELKVVGKKTKNLRLSMLAVALLLLIATLITKQKNIALLTLLVVVFPYLYVFVKTVENSAMILLIKKDKLTEGDWLVQSIKIKNKIIKPSWEGLTTSEIKLIQKTKSIKQVLIKQGIPFVPVFLFAAIASLFGNLLAMLVNLFI